MTLAQDSSDPTGVAETGNGGSATARARERKAHAAIELKKDGNSWGDIAEILGYPTPRAALVATEQALEKGIFSQESQEFMRQVASMRLEELLFAVQPKATDRDCPEQLAAVGKARELIETHMKLNGYAAPAELAIYNPLDSEVSEFVAAMQQRHNAGKTLTESDIFETEADDAGVYHVTGVDTGHYGKDKEPEPEPVVDDKDFF
jgi:hypothetical protein